MPEALGTGKAIQQCGLTPGFLGVVGVGMAPGEFAEMASAAGARALVQDNGLTLFSVSAPGLNEVGYSADGIACVLSGEIYGSVGTADVELPARVVAAYRAGGVSAWTAQDGIFALALWDVVRRELLLYRDPSAGADLFYVELADGTLAFSTHLSHLMALVPAARTVARRSLHEYLRFLDISPPNAILTGVSALEPSYLLRWRDGVAEPPHAIASGRAPLAGQLPRSLGGAADGLEVRLTRAVAERIPKQGSVASFLSGGLDSSLICALANEQAADRIEAVTVGFHEAPNDESATAAQIALQLKISHRVLRFSLDEYHEAFPAWISSLDYPYADPAGLPTYLAYREVRLSHAVALDGTGADELFAIMPARHVRVAGQYVARLPRGVRAHATHALGRLGPLARYRPLFDFDEPEELLIRWHGWTRREIEALLGEPVSLAHTRFYRLYRSFPASAHLARYSALFDSFPSDRVFQSAAATGLRVRLPFLASPVQEYMRTLPMEFRYHPSESKRLLREILGRRVPPVLWDLPKHGFDFPLVAFLRHRQHALIHDCVEHIEAAAHGLFVPEVVREYCRRFIAGDDRVAFKVWALVVFQAWHDSCCLRGLLDGVPKSGAPPIESHAYVG